jgi:hypothetical protein
MMTVYLTERPQQFRYCAMLFALAAGELDRDGNGTLRVARDGLAAYACLFEGKRFMRFQHITPVRLYSELPNVAVSFGPPRLRG